MAFLPSSASLAVTVMRLVPISEFIRYFYQFFHEFFSRIFSRIFSANFSQFEQLKKKTNFLLAQHSMTWANLNKNKKVFTSTTTASKYMPKKPKIYINWNPPLSDPNLLSNNTSKCEHYETIFTLKKVVFENFMKWRLKGFWASWVCT